MKWDQERPAKAAVERCRVCLDSPPTGDFGFSFLIYPPTRAQWRARAGGLRGGFPNPAKLICMGFAKNGLASSQPHKGAAPHPAQRARGLQRATGSLEALALCAAAPRPPAFALPSLFSYTHRPRSSGAYEPAGWGVDFPVPPSQFVWVSLKMGSRARTPERRAVGHQRPGREPPTQAAPPTLYPRRTYPILPGHLPYTPGAPTLYLPARLPAGPPPTCPSTPTLHS